MNGVLYHETVAQPYRIQKRLALNQCFRVIRQGLNDPEHIVYVTFGGADLYDTMDLLGVFDLTRTEINVISYEHTPSIARAARKCPVYKAVSKISSIRIQIVPKRFPADLKIIRKARPEGPFIYFLDYTGTFSHADSRIIYLLLDQHLLMEGDHLMITSCLAPRVVNQERFMSKHIPSFQLLFQRREIDAPFKLRNHVDLLLALALSEFERTSAARGARQQLRAKLLCKYKYADASPIGLWLYRLEAGRPTIRMPDIEFEEFPHAFGMPSKGVVPSIFD